MNAERSTITMADGRTVEVLTEGPPDGLPLVIHHGTPGGGLVPYPPKTEAEVARGLRAIHFARPGYGDSTPRPGRTVADVVGDVAGILDALGVATFITWGASGGGPHALACAALLPDRCLAAATIAGAAPSNAEGLDWLAGMGPENIEEFGAAQRGEADLTAFLEKEAASLGNLTGADIIDGLGSLIGDADKAVLTGEYADHQASALRASVRTGIAGWRDDDIAFVADWGFPLGPAGPARPAGPAGLPVPVAIWQGDDDRMVPFSHGQWLAARIPGAQAHLLPGEGHLSLAERHYGEILDDLLRLTGLGG